MEYRFDQALGSFVLLNDVTIKSFGKIFATNSIMVWTHVMQFIMIFHGLGFWDFALGILWTQMF